MTTKWLNDNEMRGWRALVDNYGRLVAALECDLAPHGLCLGDYEVLALLSESPGRMMRMCDLSVRLGLSPSGLTRRLDGLVRCRYVTRVPSTADRRVMNAQITDLGFDALGAVAPTHLASVRRHLIDRLTPEQITTLGDIFVAVGEGFRQPGPDCAN